MKILIVEDHQMMCDLLTKVCGEELGHEVVASVADGKDAVLETLEKNPDLLILDLMLPDMDGFAVVEKIRKQGRTPRILAVSSRCDAHTVYRVEQARLDGFIDKKSSMLEEFRIAIGNMASRRPHFSATFIDLQKKRRRSPQGFDKLLTRRQQNILSLIGDMLGDQEIARRLRLSIFTAEKHRYRIMKKLGISTRAELVKYARVNGFRALSEKEYPDEPSGR
jgi:DNA-binding NarL/FixJ family response regulator